MVVFLSQINHFILSMLNITWKKAKTSLYSVKSECSVLVQ